MTQILPEMWRKMLLQKISIMLKENYLLGDLDLFGYINHRKDDRDSAKSDHFTNDTIHNFNNGSVVKTIS